MKMTWTYIIKNLNKGPDSNPYTKNKQTPILNMPTSPVALVYKIQISRNKVQMQSVSSENRINLNAIYLHQTNDAKSIPQIN